MSEVVLPNNSPVRRATGELQISKALARASACLAACRDLHQARPPLRWAVEGPARATPHGNACSWPCQESAIPCLTCAISFTCARQMQMRSS